MTLNFGCDQRLDLLAVFVFELLQLKLGGQRLDQFYCETKFLIGHQPSIGFELLVLPDLARIEHRVHQDSAFTSPDNSDMLSAVHGHLRQSDITGLLQRRIQQRVRFLASAFWRA